MATETEIERLVVRLLGDGKNYQQMLKDAQKQTEKYTRGIDGKLRDAQGRFVTDQQRMATALAATNSRMGRLAIRMQMVGSRLTSVGGAFRSAGQSMQRFGRSMSLYVTAPLALMGGLAVRAFAGFDKAMVESTSIMKVTTDQIERMRKTALELSGTTIQSPKELAESYFFLASAGKTAEQSMSLLPKVAQFATAGAFDMALATDLLTDAQSALGLTSKNVAIDTANLVRVSDVLVKANTLANASVQQFSTALTSKAGAALKAYNKDVEEGVSVLAALADQGVKAELAGNALDRVIRLSTKGAIDNAKAHERLGFRVFDEAGKMRNLGDIIGNLEDVLKGMSDETRAAELDALGFQARVQGVILPLLGTSEAIKQYEKELRKAGGTTKEVADKQMKSFSNQMKLFKNQLTVVGIEIGQILAPAITKLTESLKGSLKWWKNLSLETKKTILIIAGIAAAIGPALIGLGGLTIAIGVATTAIGFLSTAMAFLIAHPVVAALAAIAAAAVWLTIEFTAASRVAKEWQEIISQSTERGKEQERQLVEQVNQLRNLSREQGLSNSEMDQAQKIIDDLTGLYGPLGLEIDRTTGSVKGLEDAQKKLAETNRRLRILDLKIQLEELQKQYDEAKAKSTSFWRRQSHWAKEARALNEKVIATQIEVLNLQRADVSIPGVGPVGADTNKAAAVAAAVAAADVVDADLAARLAASKKSIEEYFVTIKREQKRLMEEGKRIIEQQLSPLEKLKKKTDELFRMQKLGIFKEAPQTFRRAMEAAVEEARKEIGTLEKEKIKVNVSIRFTGAEAGSAEALSRIAEFRAAIGQSLPGLNVPGVSQPGTPGMQVQEPQRGPEAERVRDDLKRLEDISIGIDRLVELGEDEADKPGVVIQGAGLQDS